MATVTGTVEAVSTKFGKFSVLINEKWYNTKQEWAPKPLPTKGDQITFDDGGKNYLSKCKVVGSSTKTGVSGGSGGGGKGGYNPMGVELGQAMNLAMTVAMSAGGEPGSEGFYKFWIEQTETIYAISRSLRTKMERQEGTASDLSEEVEKPKGKSKSEDSDLF